MFNMFSLLQINGLQWKYPNGCLAKKVTTVWCSSAHHDGIALICMHVCTHTLLCTQHPGTEFVGGTDVFFKCVWVRVWKAFSQRRVCPKEGCCDSPPDRNLQLQMQSCNQALPGRELADVEAHQMHPLGLPLWALACFNHYHRTLYIYTSAHFWGKQG